MKLNIFRFWFASRLVQTCVKCSRWNRFYLIAFYEAKIQRNLPLGFTQPVGKGLKQGPPNV